MRPTLLEIRRKRAAALVMKAEIRFRSALKTIGDAPPSDVQAAWNAAADAWNAVKKAQAALQRAVKAELTAGPEVPGGSGP